MTPLFTSKHPVAVALDFDGTITDVDVVDTALVQFSKNSDWLKIEAEWAAGKIGSDECMARQLAGVELTAQELEAYLDSVNLDPGFKHLHSYLNEKGVPLVVLSDGYDLFIKGVFARYGVRNVPFRCNSMRHEGTRLIPSYPHKSSSCGRCGHCKQATLDEAKKLVKHIIFAGDGMSDLCALKSADTVFAKGKLAKYCQEKGFPHIPYRTLEDVALALPEILDRVAAGTAPTKATI
jgi:2-hydroxy-3-keto-5-methylthiopentenyl-1-phosphate phosphatase